MKTRIKEKFIQAELNHYRNAIINHVTACKYCGIIYYKNCRKNCDCDQVNKDFEKLRDKYSIKCKTAPTASSNQ